MSSADAKYQIEARDIVSEMHTRISSVGSVGFGGNDWTSAKESTNAVAVVTSTTPSKLANVTEIIFIVDSNFVGT